MISKNPILNNPYEAPSRFYSTDLDGNLDYNTICPGRRIFKPDTNAIPGKQKEQKQLYEWNDEAVDYGKNIINLLRNEIAIWRAQNYLNTTRVTKELLTFWFNNPERNVTQKLFYAQQEAIETAIWLNEVAEKSNSGQFILRFIREGQQSVSSDATDQLPRMAFKMATGTGKTVVMACLMCYHFFNRQEYRNDTRFADYFLIVVPGITIKDRLGVLFVDTETKNPNNIQDYYRVRGLIPQNLLPRLENLNSRLVITNYHTFEPKVLQGNKKSPFDGKTSLDGTKQEAKEDFNQIIKRTVGKFRKESRLLILNDEAHHCYLPKSKTKTTDNEDDDENARAAVWFSGLRELAKKFKLQAVYDLSATPYYLTGSGYPAYSLFPWVVSDFGLIEAIESGLVKIPFLPEKDNAAELDIPILRDLYRKVIEKDPNAFPRKGIKKKKSEAHAKGEEIEEKKPNLHPWVKGALDQF